MARRLDRGDERQPPDPLSALSTPPSSSPGALVRFDAVQRGAHWVSAVLFVLLIGTAIPLYFGSFFGVVLPRFGVEQLHLWTGIILPVPLALSVLGRWGRGMRRDLSRINLWRREEIEWLRSFGRTPIAADKFNPGQKLNAILVAASGAVLFATGIILKWFDYFPVSWRAGSTFVHDTVAWLLVALISGHVVMALTHREALASMVHGRVSERWAARHAPAWWREGRTDASTWRGGSS